MKSASSELLLLQLLSELLTSDDADLDEKRKMQRQRQKRRPKNGNNADKKRERKRNEPRDRSWSPESLKKPRGGMFPLRSRMLPPRLIRFLLHPHLTASRPSGW